jgi:hypothetical protein
MRDLLNIFDNLIVEANLSATAMPARKMSGFTNPATKKRLSRQELFLWKVKNSSPFTLVSGAQVTINPKEARNVASWINQGMPKPITMKTTDGGQVKNTDILKTVEFGSVESQTIAIKPSDVLPTDAKQDVADLGNNIEVLLSAGGFPASEMYDRIANSPALAKMGKLGDAVIYMANQANQGQVPVFPENLTKDQIKAIELYASEYLGVLGLISGAVPFIRGSREQFEEFVGSSISDMIMFFPRASNNPLADSFSVVNNNTGHAVKISSKAAGKGAPPSLSSMRLPDEVRKKYPEAAEFLDAAQNPSLSQFTQPFALMNYLYEINPSKVPKAYRTLMPFSPELIARLESSNKTGAPLPLGIMKVFEKQLNPKVFDSDAPDGGKAWYAVISDVMRAVNTDRAVPDLRPALIESLGYNFVQLYTNVKGNKLVTEAFWPAKIAGNVKLKTKGSAGEIKGKMSVEISPGAGDDEPDAMIAGASTEKPQNTKQKDLDAELDKPRLRGPGAKAAKARAAPKTDVATLGRKKRG